MLVTGIELSFQSMSTGKSVDAPKNASAKNAELLSITVFAEFSLSWRSKRTDHYYICESNKKVRNSQVDRKKRDSL